ncbi:hypothetical protein SARI_00227 [Salmonella enterica subsp. arizonae serovar 62:z4,z23:-]|uniref:Uncharacterized protein n=1 Tax=Salmonella arizonae (strain ATCC BAA-731 / CDC346-86 / RSK2980) TaxID=41514 RepID=A9MGR3_SALAR|nr:hypothetical protein SARI_00227 [Salmonella enterica subsp. arizonae serovar 62:z4,z23:-]
MTQLIKNSNINKNSLIRILIKFQFNYFVFFKASQPPLNTIMTLTLKLNMLIKTII